MNTAVNKLQGNKLELAYLLDLLQSDGMISSHQVAKLKSHLRKEDLDNTHPLTLVAEEGLQSITTPPFPLTLERLTRWLANKTGQEYYRIDPLKVDVNKITGIISQAYARKLKILPLQVK